MTVSPPAGTSRSFPLERFNVSETSTNSFFLPYFAKRGFLAEVSSFEVPIRSPGIPLPLSQSEAISALLPFLQATGGSSAERTERTGV